MAQAEDQNREQEAEALEEAVHVGRQRLYRSWPELLSTGFVAGVDVGFGVLALILVEHETHSKVLGALAFTIGFVALLLAQAELFDENYLVPVAAVIADRPGPWPLLRLWGGMLSTNLAGGWVFAGVAAAGLLPMQKTALTLGEQYVKMGVGRQSFALGVLGGAVITLMTWMEQGSESEYGQILAAIMGGFLVASVPLPHVIVMSLEMFVGLHMGATFGYLVWLKLAAWVTLANLVGGLLLVTLLRVVQAEFGHGEAPVSEQEATEQEEDSDAGARDEERDDRDERRDEDDQRGHEGERQPWGDPITRAPRVETGERRQRRATGQASRSRARTGQTFSREDATQRIFRSLRGIGRPGTRSDTPSGHRDDPRRDPRKRPPEPPSREP